MKFVADVHLHSHYSRATSKNLDFEHLALWAQLKGVNVVGTGDIAHPGWLQEMHDKLEPAEEGLFRLKDEVAQAVQEKVPVACQAPVRFMLAGEISSIYKKNDRVRKVHNIIFAPHLEAVEKIQAELEKIGNIRSDGRPILGLPSRDLLEIIMEVDPACYLIPAHIWTPWFSMLGSKSGYDSVEECFEDLTPHIFALETGLSSDPPMNWRVSNLDGYTLISNSDAHSPQKLAREANLFDTDLSYPAFFEALQTGDPEKFLGTFEFFPDEGKYHYDGHRKCDIRWTPKTTIEHNNLCPVCGKAVTVGVLHRVEVLADRDEGEKPEQTHPFKNIIPLPEILGEVNSVGPNSKKVQRQYDQLLDKLGSDLNILLDIPLEDISQTGGTLLAEGIRRMRTGEVSIASGYDGEYGIIKLFEPDEKQAFSAQMSMFGAEPKTEKKPKVKPVSKSNVTTSAKGKPNKAIQTSKPPKPKESTVDETDLLSGLNEAQRAAVLHTDGPLLIMAGPGTGKTRTLTYRIAYLITEQNIALENILAITFTNKATDEMKRRLSALLGKAIATKISICTFHAFGANILREAGHHLDLSPDFTILSDQDQLALLKQIQPNLTDKERGEILSQISTAKNQLWLPNSPELIDQAEPNFLQIYETYQSALKTQHLVDYDDLIFQVARLFEQNSDVLTDYQKQFRWISVDEYQDINLAQYRLLRLLVGPDTNLCTIGDPDQAIYGFRGARREYFLNFEQDFPQAKTMHLDQNYRSTQKILEAAHQVITHNADASQMKIWSDFVDETKLEVHQAPTDKAEAEYIIQQIELMMGGTSYFSLDSGRSDNEEKSYSFADFAVLYRLNAQSQPLIEAFERSGMPYQVTGQRALADYKDVRTLLAALRYLYDPLVAWPMDDLLSQKRKLQLMGFIDQLRGKGIAETIVAQLDVLHEFMTEQEMLQTNKGSQTRFSQLRRRAIPFGDITPAFLESMALQRDVDDYDPRADRVALMTMHAAKGLEFPVVFIIGCEEGLLPYEKQGESTDIDEERRLFYVGLTRAQHKLILVNAKRRFLFGTEQQNQSSRFVSEIEAALKVVKEAKRRKVEKKGPESTQLKLF